MSVFCRHEWRIETKNNCIYYDSPSSYFAIEIYMQFMCEKCHKFKDKTYYICYTNGGASSYAIISKNWNFTKRIADEKLITFFDDKHTMIDTIRADLKYQSFIKKIEKKIRKTFD